MKDNRLFSFIVVTVVYVLAVFGGVWAYNQIEAELWLSLLCADVFATVLTFIFSLIFKNASVYDPYWSVQPIVITVAFFIGQPFDWFKFVFVLVVCLWGIRLTLNWAYTFKSLRHEDWRYRMLHEKTRGFYPIVNFVGIHLVPTLVVYACTIPVVVVLNSAIRVNSLSLAFLAVSVIAFTIQGIADIEMHKYRKNRTTPFIRVGLWKHSRHPNYLGEILMWWGVGFASVTALAGSNYLLIGALLNTLLFTFVSIPMADKRQSKKDGFEEYKKETRVLLPIKK
ncbi:MAG: DUF1295 domain-containing protein [Clostridia bacterium]|nr:DUF1295 domain-containing protein [Clostridia bacterium]